jgi:hypothetical protein
MESFENAVRHKLVLGRFPVVGVKRSPTGFKFALQLPGIKLVLEVPPSADVREGDVLTLYTEVLAHGQTRPN